MTTSASEQELSEGQPPPPPPRSIPTREPVQEPARKPARRSGIGPALFLTALLVAGGGFLLFFYLEHEPQRLALESTRSSLAREEEARAALDARVSELEAEREQLQRRVGELRGSEEALRSERDQIARERDVLRAGNEQAQAALAAMQEAQEALRQRLSAELASGEAELSGDGDSVTVGLTDRILFPSGAAELNARGREVLARVAASLASLPDRLVRVEGHTDSTPISPERTAQFPTNWELSTARATTVVRFLQERGIPGERLAAVGFGEHRPIADNGSANGRRKNRRIELVLSRATVTTGRSAR